MANLCCNSLCITGESEQFNKLKKLIESQDEEFLKLYWIFTSGDWYGLSEISYIEKDSMSLNLNTKWPPGGRYSKALFRIP